MGRTKEKRKSGNGHPPSNGGGKKDFIPFDQRTVSRLTEDLNHIAAFSDISWEFTEDGQLLIVKGFDAEGPVEFTGFRGAKAFFDGYLLGYDHGYGDGKSDRDAVSGSDEVDE